MRPTRETKMPKVIKLKNKPQKPRRGKNRNYYYTYDGESLRSIIDNVPDDAKFTTKTSYYDSVEYLFEWEEEESEESWLRKLNRYNQRLEDYNEWYEENKENIEYTLTKQKENQITEKRIEAKKKKEELEKELEKLNKILK